MRVNFFLKDSKKNNTSIDAIIRYRGKRFKLATGISVEVQYWDAEKYRAREIREYQDAKMINIQLSRYETAISKLFDKYLLENHLPTPAEIKTALKPTVIPNLFRDRPSKTQPTTFLSFFTPYYLNAGYDAHTVKKYKTAENWLLKYQRATGKPLTFADITIDFYYHFRHFVISKTYVRKKGEQPQHYSLNYFGSLIKCVKRAMKASGPESRLKLHQNTDYASDEFRTESETADTVYLSVAELETIHRFTPTVHNIAPVIADPRLSNRQRAVEAMVLAKNKFLIGAFTALRVSDFNRLSEVNLKENRIRIKPKKGTRKNEDVIIPIHPIVREILASGFNIATPIYEQKINKHIKHVCQLCRIEEMVSVARTEGGRLVERVLPKYELVSTHTARRSGATNMYLAGIPTISIMKITGHRTERSFLKYIRISQEENADLLANHPFFKHA